jgi:hypothetical protein
LRLDQFELGVLIDLLAEQAHKRIEGIFVDGAALPPHRAQNFLTRDHAADIFDQEFEDAEFSLGEMNFTAVAEGSKRSDIESQAAEFQNVSAAELMTAHQGSDACQKLLEGKRFRQVVIGTGVKTADDVVQRIPGGKHQDGCFLLSPAENPRYLKAAHPGQHDVEENDVEGLSGGEFECCQAIPGVADLILLLAKAAGEQNGHFRFVFYDEDSHTLYPSGKCSLASMNGWLTEDYA